MQTLKSYEQEPHQSSWWKRVLGTVLAFSGFVLLTNAFLLLLPFGQQLPQWGEAALSLFGGAIGTVGLKLKGHQGDTLVEPVILVIGGVISNVFVSLISARFGLLGLIVLLLLFYIFETQIRWRINNPKYG